MSLWIDAYWPEVTVAQIVAQPEFQNGNCWAVWRSRTDGDPDVETMLASLGCLALLTFRVADQANPNADVQWVSPAELTVAALTLRAAVLERDDVARLCLDQYDDLPGPEADAREEFARDLEDIATIARWAEDQGAKQMTFSATY